MKATARKPASAARERATRPAAGATASTASPGPRWTFLTNHAHVLILLSQDPSLRLREVAARVGITERGVQRIIAELEEDGYIEREKIGRQNRYRIHAKRPLRHPIEAHRTFDELRALISD